jgi:ribosomal protein S4
LIRKYRLLRNKKHRFKVVTINFKRRIFERRFLIIGFQQNFLYGKNQYLFPRIIIKFKIGKDMNYYRKYLLTLLRREMQLNILLLRLFFVTSVQLANYLIKYRYIHVNLLIMTDPIYITQPNDLIFISYFNQCKLYYLRIFIKQTIGLRKRLTKYIKRKYY